MSFDKVNKVVLEVWPETETNIPTEELVLFMFNCDFFPSILEIKQVL